MYADYPANIKREIDLYRRGLLSIVDLEVRNPSWAYTLRAIVFAPDFE